MEYLKSYKIFEELEKEKSNNDIEVAVNNNSDNTDLSTELKKIGKDLKNHGKELRELVMKIAQDDDEIKDKLFDKTFETFKFTDNTTDINGNSSIIEFIETVNDLYNVISKLSNLWDYDHNFKLKEEEENHLDLNNYLGEMGWVSTSLDEIGIYHWVSELEKHYNVNIPQSFINFDEPDINGSVVEYLKMVYIVLKESEYYAEKLTNIYNRLEEKDSLPMVKYPFSVPMDELSDSFSDWSSGVVSKISPIIMKKQMDKLFNDINEDIKLEKYNKFKQNESLTLGLALSSGAILQGVGKLLSFIGKKLSDDDQNTLLKVGQTIEKYGHNIHHGIIKLINTILKPLIFWLEPKKQEMVCNVVFMGILAIKVSSGSFDPNDYKSFSSLVEALLNGIKSTEIASFIKTGAKGLITLSKSLG